MYQIIKNVIERGSYDLTAILQKVNTLWVNGNITDEQYDELLGLARSGAQPKDSVDIIARLNDLESRVRALESNTQIETPTEYTPNADGTVNGVTSLYPNTTLMTDTEGVIIDCEYNRDINKAFAALEAAIATNNS